jgi:adenylate cyclase
MSRSVLLIQADAKTAQDLSTYFDKRGDQVWQADNVAQAGTLIKRHKPDLVFIDLHLPRNSWEEAMGLVSSALTSAKVIVTNDHPDLRRELQAKEQGINVFLRRPFTPAWIEKAIRANATTAPSLMPARATLPKVGMSMRVKITFPYVLLAMMFALAAAFLVSRYVLESIRLICHPAY